MNHNNHLRVLSKIFSLAVNADLLDGNPCRKVKNFQPNNQRTRFLSMDVETRLFAALAGNAHSFANIVTVALHTGLRRGEIFNLTWFDVDFTRNLIQIRESKSNKTRFVPMNQTVGTLLRGLKRTNELVFPSPRTGGKLDNLKKSFRRAVETAGIEDFRFHDLRHTAATRMADAGADAFTLMKILGHSDIRMTARYTHATDAAIRRAVETLDANSDFGNELVTKQKGQAGELTLND